ncbi:hypothetical protein NORO109296_16450 [Nocardiopsis rhodophaea]
MEDCAVLAPLLNGASTLAALVVLEPSIGESDEVFSALRARLRRRLEPFRVPKRWTQVPDIPRTGSGKIMRHKLNSILGSDTPGADR